MADADLGQIWHQASGFLKSHTGMKLHAVGGAWDQRRVQRRQIALTFMLRAWPWPALTQDAAYIQPAAVLLQIVQC